MIKLKQESVELQKKDRVLAKVVVDVSPFVGQRGLVTETSFGKNGAIKMESTIMPLQRQAAVINIGEDGNPYHDLMINDSSSNSEEDTMPNIVIKLFINNSSRSLGREIQVRLKDLRRNKKNLT